MKRTPLVTRWQLWLAVAAVAIFVYEANVYIHNATAWAENQGIASSTAHL